MAAASYEAIEWDELERMKQDVAGQEDDGFYGNLVKWHLTDISERTISPFSEVTFDQYLANALEAGTVASLEEAVLIDPRNGEAYQKLAELLERPSDDQGGHGSSPRIRYYQRLAEEFGVGTIRANQDHAGE